MKRNKAKSKSKLDKRWTRKGFFRVMKSELLMAGTVLNRESHAELCQDLIDLLEQTRDAITRHIERGDN